MPAGAQTMQGYCNKKELCKGCDLHKLLPNNCDLQTVLKVWQMVETPKMMRMSTHFLRIEPGV